MKQSAQSKIDIAARIQASLFERARSFTRRRQVQILSDELGLPRTFDRDLETLQSVASIKAHLCEPIRTIIDIGAHVGAFAEPAMRALRAEEVVCVEPYAPLHDQLRSRLHGLNHRIIDCALADTFGAGMLRVHADRSMNSLLDADSHILAAHFNTYDHKTIERAQVRISTLDREVACLQLPEPFLIKLDTQGTELQILRGSVQALRRSAAVLVEHMFTTPYLSGSCFADLIIFMNELGFTCAGATEIKRRSNHVSGVDFLLCRTTPSSSCHGPRHVQ